MKDFDELSQKRLRKLASSISFDRNWNRWPYLSKEEFESEAEKNTGVSIDSIPKEITEPEEFALKGLDELKNQIIIHTSGTSGNPKYFVLTRKLIESVWAPGMHAIFNSAGLERKGNAVIFVPERMPSDGVDENGNLILYSSEFSQRLAMEILGANYVISTYPKSRSLDVISQILEMESVNVVSAPVSTILRWADLRLFANGIKKDLNNPKKGDLEKILKKPFEKAVKEIHAILWEKLKEATFILSFSSVTDEKWEKIGKFVKKKCNLYVSSEIGPFASSLCMGDSMYVFPLSIPVFREDFRAITRTERKYGELLITNCEHVNIKTGDAEILENNNPPKISKEVLRTPIKLGSLNGKAIYTAGYWRENCEVVNTYAIMRSVKGYKGRFFFDVDEKRLYVEKSPHAVERSLKKNNGLEKGGYLFSCDFSVEERRIEFKKGKREWWFYFLKKSSEV